jgi:hypothetical protein
MPAMTIFAMLISFLRNHMLKRLEKEKPLFKESDIKYILTVPAIWKENAKQFMREAAVEVIDLICNFKIKLFFFILKKLHDLLVISRQTFSKGKTIVSNLKKNNDDKSYLK